MTNVTDKIKKIKELFDEVLDEIEEPETDSIEEKRKWVESTRPAMMMYISNTKGNSSSTKPKPMNNLNDFLEHVKKRVGMIQERIDVLSKV